METNFQSGNHTFTLMDPNAANLALYYSDHRQITPSNGNIPTNSSVPSDPVPKKRGRPRKYGSTQNQSTQFSAKIVKKNLPGNVGQGFTPHTINVSAGEDVGQKIMSFMHQCKGELCIMSASGTISNASLSQPAMSGGTITIEGQFDIISLSGSYVRTELGRRSGGLSVCLSTTNGQIIGGGVGGPLKAAGPVQVIVGTFTRRGTKSEVGAKVNTPASNMSFQPTVESLGHISGKGSDEHRSIAGMHYVTQPRPVQISHSEPMSWRVDIDAGSGPPFDLTGRATHVPEKTPENMSYTQS